MAATPEEKMESTVRLIKKYPNRRLYDTANSGYITLADVKQMVLDNIDFKVIDAKAGDARRRRFVIEGEGSALCSRCHRR